MKIAFIGGGNMGRAMISAIVGKDLAFPDDITVADVREESRRALIFEFGVRATASNIEAVRNADVIILAVKPQNLPEVAAELSSRLEPRQLVVSIIAGKMVKTLVKELKHQSIVRVMPNTPAMVNRGMSVWTATDAVTDGQKETARRILSALGDELFTLDEGDLDKATALSGSGPAYFFLFMEALIEAGVKLGFTPEVARQLTIQTAVGSSEFARQSGKDLAELRKMVTSPGGTTAEALKIFEARNFKDLVNHAVMAALQRARELGG